MRCLALAEVLAEEGWTVTFAGTQETAQTVSALRRSGHDFVSLSDGNDPAVMWKAISSSCDLLVIDHYGLDAVYETACRSFARRILVIDDLANRNHDCDLLLDPTLGRDIKAYRDRLPASARIVTGPLYALLHSSFAAARSEERNPRNAVRRILLSMGATDASGRTIPMFKALSCLHVGVDVVVGSSARDIAEIRSTVEQFGGRIHVDTPDMAQLMADADIAVLAAGTTTWEAACLGLGIVLIITADNQIEVAHSMENAGGAILAESVDDAVRAVSRLIADRDARSALSRAASCVCDGLGARRIAILIDPERDAEGRAVTLRPATLDDADLILAWQQHPDTRRFARNPAVPARAEHEAWLAQKLADSNSLLQIVMCDDTPAGLIRLDCAQAAAGREVSILTAPEQYNRGIGFAALRLARRLVSLSPIRAFVLPGNEPSLRLFEKAGYKPAGGDWLVQEPVSKMAMTA